MTDYDEAEIHRLLAGDERGRTGHHRRSAGSRPWCSAARWRARTAGTRSAGKVTEQFPGLTIACDIGVVRAQAPSEVEEIS